MSRNALFVSLCALVGVENVCGFSCTPAALRVTAGSSSLSGLVGARCAQARPLDPLTLQFAPQSCPLRPYKSKEENGGLSTATFALG